MLSYRPKYGLERSQLIAYSFACGKSLSFGKEQGQPIKSSLVDKLICVVDISTELRRWEAPGPEQSGQKGRFESQ